MKVKLWFLSKVISICSRLTNWAKEAQENEETKGFTDDEKLKRAFIPRAHAVEVPNLQDSYIFKKYKGKVQASTKSNMSRSVQAISSGTEVRELQTMEEARALGNFITRLEEKREQKKSSEAHVSNAPRPRDKAKSGPDAAPVRSPQGGGPDKSKRRKRKNKGRHDLRSSYIVKKYNQNATAIVNSYPTDDVRENKSISEFQELLKEIDNKEK